MSRYAIRLQNDGFMAAAPDEAYDFGTGDFTVEAWVQAASAGTIVARKESAGGAGNGGWLLVLRADGSIKLATDNGSGFFELASAPTALLAAGGWHHVAGVRQDGRLSLFLDGLPLQGSTRGTGASPLDVDNGLRVTVGATDQQQEPDNHLDGLVGRLWQAARTQEQILEAMFRGVEPGAEGLAANWALARPTGADQSPTRTPWPRCARAGRCRWCARAARCRSTWTARRSPPRPRGTRGVSRTSGLATPYLESSLRSPGADRMVPAQRPGRIGPAPNACPEKAHDARAASGGLLQTFSLTKPPFGPIVFHAFPVTGLQPCAPTAPTRPPQAPINVLKS